MTPLHDIFKGISNNLLLVLCDEIFYQDEARRRRAVNSNNFILLNKIQRNKRLLEVPLNHFLKNFVVNATSPVVS
jgi:hypothetical protein